MEVQSMNTDFKLAVQFGVDTSPMDKGLKNVQKAVKKATSGIAKAFSGVNGGMDKTAGLMSGSFNTAINKIAKNANKLESSLGKACGGIKSTVGKTTNNMKNNFNKAFDKIKSMADEAEGDVSDSFNKMSGAMKTAMGALATYASASVFNGLIDAGTELNKTMGRVEGAFKSAGGSAKTGAQTFKNFNAVLGDADKATETSQLLAKITTDEGRLMDLTNSLTGVYAQFGDSLPIESLAESINETQKVGEVTGTLADALNWAGISEEAFNEQLANCNSESERSALIQSTLAKLYGESGKAYQEANKDMMELTNAELRMQEAQAKLGESLVPIKTELLNLGSVLLEKLSPYVQSFAEKILPKLQGAFSKVGKWLNTFKNALNNVDWDKYVKGLESIWEALKSVGEGIFNNLFGDKTAEEAITDTFDAIGNTLEDLQPTFEWIEKHGQGVADALVAIAKGLIAYKVFKGFKMAFDNVLAFLKGMSTSPVNVGLVAAGAFISLYEFGKGQDWYKHQDNGGKGFSSTRNKKLNEHRKQVEVNENHENFSKSNWTENWENTKKDFKEMGEWFTKVGQWFVDLGETIGETMDGWYEKYFEGALEACGKFLRGENKWGQNLVKFFKELPFKIANAITGGKGTIGKSFEDIMDDAIIKLNIKINSLIGTINKFFEKLGISTRIGSVTFGTSSKYQKQSRRGGEQDVYAWAKGTNNAPAGLSLVGEAGRELIADPKLGTFMANSATLVNLSKGATVLSNKNTEKVLKSFGVSAYAKGKNEGGFWSNVWDYVTKPAEIVRKLFEGLNIGGSSKFHQAVNELFTGGIKNGVLEYIKKIMNSSEVINNPNNIAGVTDFNGWKAQIIKAASFFGDKLTQNEIARVLQQIKTESGGRQNAIQSMKVWDINAQTGNLARGLLQYVPSTFDAYKVKGYGNIYNGYHQLLAFFNNSAWRRNLPQLGEIRGWTPRGARRMANGGIVTSPTHALIGEAGYNEAVVPLTAGKVKPFGEAVVNELLNLVGTGSGSEQELTINVPVYLDSQLIGKSTAKVVQSEIAKFDKRNNRLNGKR